MPTFKTILQIIIYFIVDATRNCGKGFNARLVCRRRLAAQVNGINSATQILDTSIVHSGSDSAVSALGIVLRRIRHVAKQVNQKNS